MKSADRKQLIEKIKKEEYGREWPSFVPQHIRDAIASAAVAEMVEVIGDVEKATHISSDEQIKTLSDADIAANTGEFSEEEITTMLDSRTPAMQSLLTAKPDTEE